MSTKSKKREGSLKALLGELLKDARLEGGFKRQTDLSDALGLDRTGVTRVETGERLPNGEVMSEWLTRCDVTGLARKAIEGLLQIAKLTSEDSPVKIWFKGYLKAELAAHTLRIWQPLILHGLFQTEAYARAVFVATARNAQRIEEMMAVRMERQAVLGREEPPNIVALIDEPVLHRLIGSPEIMREQLEHILRLSEIFVIQVVPSRIGANAGLGGAITLAAQVGAAEVLAAEALVEDQVTNDVSTVMEAAVTFDRIRADALGRAESRNAIQEALEKWNSQTPGGASPPTAATAE